MKLEQAKKIVETEAKKMLKYDNINSVGIGYKTVNGKKTKEVVIQFTVDRKMDTSVLEDIGTIEIPPAFELDGETIKTDVIQRVYKPSFQLINAEITDIRKTRQNPVFPGISLAHKNVTAGTFGCVVYGRNNAKPYILSNWHVLDGNSGQIGDAIFQPGKFDSSDTANNTVGKLAKSFLGEAGDCAIATIENRSFHHHVLGLETTPKQIASAELDDLVVKSGRTTAVTYGVVRRIDILASINYGGTAGSQDIKCFEIEPDPNFPAHNDEISMGGDSGSIWLVRDKNGKSKDIVLGLHFAGEGRTNPDEHALACYIDAVFDKMEVRL